MPSTFFFSDSPSTVTSTDAVITSSSYGGRTSTLTSVQLGNEVISIGLLAFYNCTSLASITIPMSVTSIADQVFYNCNSLNRINFLGNPPTLGSNVFTGATPANLKIYRYSTKSGWSSTFGGKDVLLIETPSKGLRTFGFDGISSGKISIKKTNIGGGKISLL